MQVFSERNVQQGSALLLLSFFNSEEAGMQVFLLFTGISCFLAYSSFC